MREEREMIKMDSKWFYEHFYEEQASQLTDSGAKIILDYLCNPDP